MQNELKIPHKYKLAGDCKDSVGTFIGRYVVLWHPNQQKEFDSFCQSWLDTYKKNRSFYLVRDYETQGLHPNLGQIILCSVAWDMDNGMVFVPANFDCTLWKECLNTIPTVNQNCLHRETLVTLADGSKKSIGKIVNDKEQVEVLSWNSKTNSLEPKKVVNWFRNGKKENWLEVRFAYKPVGANLLVTENHEIYTEGYIKKPAGSLKVGDVVYLNSMELSYLQRQLIIGSALGNGTLAKSNSKSGKSVNVYYRCSHSDLQKFYLDWKKGLLGSVFSKKWETTHTFNNSRPGAKLITITTKNHPNITQIYNLLYGKNIEKKRKRITSEYIKEMSLYSLAVWFMDDGWGCEQHCGIDCYSYLQEELQLLQKWLQDEYNISTSILKVKEGYRLNFLNHKEFKKKISPYILPDFAYKIKIKGYEHPTNVLGSAWDTNSPSLNLTKTKIVSIDKVSSKNKKRLLSSSIGYDIEVEDNHNYFAGNILVSNSKFDMKWEKFHFGCEPKSLLCTLVSAKVGWAGYLRDFGLDSLAEVFCDELKLDKDIRKDFIYMVPQVEDGVTYWVGSNPSHPNLEDSHMEYAVRDSMVVYRMAKPVADRLVEQGSWGVWENMEAPLIPQFADLELKGIPVDWKFVKNSAISCTKEVNDIKEKANTLLTDLPTETKQKIFTQIKRKRTEPKDTPTRYEFNPGSSAQIIKLYRHLKVKLPNTEAESLLALRLACIDKPEKQFIADITSCIIEFKKKRDFLTKYPKAWIDKYQNPVTGYIHPNFNIIAGPGQTGRMSASEPNVMALTADFRPAVTAYPGHVLSIRDYSGFEMRAAAGQSGEPELSQTFQHRAELLPLMKELVQKYGKTDPDHFVKEVMEKGFEVKSHEKDLCKEFMCVDIHRKTGSLIFKKPTEEIQGEARSIAKTINYLALYAGEAQTLQESLGKKNIFYPIERCQEILTLFRQAFPVLNEYQNKLRNRVLDPGWTSTFLGRKKYAILPPVWRSNYFKVLTDTQREFVNFDNQGANLDALKLTMVELDQWFREEFEPDHRPWVLLPIHDELVVSIPEDLFDVVDPVFEGVMVKNGALSINNTCPIECSGVRSFNLAK